MVMWLYDLIWMTQRSNINCCWGWKQLTCEVHRAPLRWERCCVLENVLFHNICKYISRPDSASCRTLPGFYAFLFLIFHQLYHGDKMARQTRKHRKNKLNNTHLSSLSWTNIYTCTVLVLCFHITDCKISQRVPSSDSEFMHYSFFVYC